MLKDFFLALPRSLSVLVGRTTKSLFMQMYTFATASFSMYILHTNVCHFHITRMAVGYSNVLWFWCVFFYVSSFLSVELLLYAFVKLRNFGLNVSKHLLFPFRFILWIKFQMEFKSVYAETFNLSNCKWSVQNLRLHCKLCASPHHSKRIWSSIHFSFELKEMCICSRIQINPYRI